jgi:hypothetical protein
MLHATAFQDQISRLFHDMPKDHFMGERKATGNGQESQKKMVSARHYSECKRASTSVCCVEGGG